MKKIVLIFSSVLIFAGGVHAADWGRVDGKYWNNINTKWGQSGEAIKANYLIGILDGFHFMIDRAERPEGAPVFPRKDMNRVISALDRFYGNPDNVKIPAVYALAIVNMQLRGVDKQTIEQVIQEKRTFWNKDGQQTVQPDSGEGARD